MSCYRCGSHNDRSELRPSKKIKGLSAKSSAELKQCKLCNCRVFINLRGK